MKIAIGADHAGVELKGRLAAELQIAGHEVRDFGTDSAESTDYPDYARLVSQAVARGEADRGILICGTGAGMAISANKVHGVRAAMGYDPEEVRLIRAHNNANVLTLGARFIGPGAASGLVKVFLDTPFDGGRHARRVDKIGKIEEEEA